MSWFIWALLSAFFAGLTAVLAKVGVAHVNSNLATAIGTVVILFFAWLVAFLTNTEPLSNIETKTWIFLVLSGIATGLSWLCYFRALQLGQASRVAPVDKLSVVPRVIARCRLFCIRGSLLDAGCWDSRDHSSHQARLS
ncbi:MAG: hypothetical protein DMG95_14125 [Acidobacteria bacterium]|nr:MAG: hypothetical protein DMG95_14125 [Acidobacteriota bacterium]